MRLLLCAGRRIAQPLGHCLQEPGHGQVQFDFTPLADGGYVQTRRGKIVQGMKSTDLRNGTVNLCAALEVATGVIHGKTTRTKMGRTSRPFSMS